MIGNKIVPGRLSDGWTRGEAAASGSGEGSLRVKGYGRGEGCLFVRGGKSQPGTQKRHRGTVEETEEARRMS